MTFFQKKNNCSLQSLSTLAEGAGVQKHFESVAFTVEISRLQSALVVELGSKRFLKHKHRCCMQKSKKIIICSSLNLWQPGS